MRIASMTIVCACSALVAGCAAGPVNRSTYDAYREALISPGFYQAHLAKCTAETRATPKLAEQAVQFTKLPKDDAARLVCERLLNAARDGRLSYEAYAEAASGRDTPERTRIMQGS